MRILINAKIYTLDAGQPEATSLVIDGNRIVAVGSGPGSPETFQDRAQTEDLQGRIVIPGLTDAHIHFWQYAHARKLVDCETATLAACLEQVADRVNQTEPGAWVRGHGWNQNEWPDCQSGKDGFPNAIILDQITTRHPAYLTAKSLHAAWANSAALRAAGIHAGTPDPADGQLQRDQNGIPTGIMFEGAMELVKRVIPEPDAREDLAAMKSAQTALWQMGLTGLHDFDRRACFSALQQMHGEAELGLRIVKSIPVEDLAHAVGVGLRTGFGDDMLRIGLVKAFADGALGPHTAAMLQPYEDEPENRGMLLMDSEQIQLHGRMAVSHGLGMVIHAIGDRANHEVLNAYEGLRQFERQQGLPHPRHRIEHVQVLHPSDINRLAGLDVIASMQPIHATSDMIAADRFWGKRAASAYAWRSLLEQRTHLAFGSDAPVESPNPFWGIHAAVTRCRADGSPGPDGWYPGQRLTRREAIQAYTTGPAYAAGMETHLGKLAPGFLADLLVLDSDPFTCESVALREIQPAATMVDGAWVYRRM